MRLKVVETNFLSYPNWIFKLVDELKREYYIMDRAFYEQCDLKTPISKKELDSLDKGHWINAITARMSDINVVIGLY